MPDIHHQLEIEAPLEAVFEAVTTPAGLNSWWTLEAEGEPVQDSHYRLYFGSDYDWMAKVVHVCKNHEITWSLLRAMEDWMPTEFGFRLSTSGKSTCVRFFHTGWKNANEHFAITTFCWGRLLHALKNYLEEGEVIPFEKRN